MVNTNSCKLNVGDPCSFSHLTSRDFLLTRSCPQPHTICQIPLSLSLFSPLPFHNRTNFFLSVSHAEYLSHHFCYLACEYFSNFLLQKYHHAPPQRQVFSKGNPCQLLRCHYSTLLHALPIQRHYQISQAVLLIFFFFLIFLMLITT